MTEPRRLLFVCSQNRLRSPTAEHVFATHPGVETLSAGLNVGADVPLSEELLRWADMVFVMEKRHREKLSREFRQALGGTRVICLDIPDIYEYMDPELVALLEKRVTPYL
ncbi:low molecular weight protein tyrosine phosphatase family protein [Pinirhizobacter soli]|uniref:low molecular weight protein tyrosine phosphatase family protein n=1 Tax=Pinirhizobacter soli TaxID=2786953 RepID=UPI00202A8B36|nr:low molecular weight protein tyrosine phosphatase family protein [Pinirhizobacter soli]